MPKGITQLKTGKAWIDFLTRLRGEAEKYAKKHGVGFREAYNAVLIKEETKMDLADRLERLKEFKKRIKRSVAARKKKTFTFIKGGFKVSGRKL